MSTHQADDESDNGFDHPEDWIDGLDELEPEDAAPVLAEWEQWQATNAARPDHRPYVPEESE